MRVTEALLYGRMGRNNTLSRQRLDKTSLPLMTGRAIDRPSEDPLRAARIEQAGRGLRRTDMHQGNIDRVRVYYQSVEATVGTVVEQLSELQAIAVSMVNGGLNPNNLAATAAQVASIADSMLSVANSKYSGKHVFSGRLENTPAYDAAGNYQGDAVGRTVSVTDGYAIQSDLSGLEVFGDPGAGEVTAFQAAQNLEAGLLANDNNMILAALDELNAAHTKATGAWSTIGFRMDELQHYEQVAGDQALNYEIQESQLVGTDYAKAASEMQFAETVYQASLATSSKLMDVLKMEARL